MGLPWYTTLETVKSALDVKLTARTDRQVGDAIAASSRQIEGSHHRIYYPTLATRYFDWPNDQYAPPWRLWLDQDELISVTSISVAGVALTSGDYLLEPANDGPPFDRIEIDLASSASFSSGDTHQRSIAVTGLWGYRNDETAVGELTANMGVSGSAGIQLSPTVGVGTILRIDDERMIVTAKTMVNSSQTLGGAGLAAQKNDETVPVQDGTAFEVGETILLGAERMLVVDIAANDLIVKRSWDGTTLATHATSTPIFALAGFSVDRAQLGTTAATHLDGATIYRFDIPPLIQALCRAEAITTIQQEQAAYGRTVGAGENEREAAGRGLAHIRQDAMTAHGRQARLGAI
jgi:hypothetical protein